MNNKALKALMDYEQADEDGIMALASRQAIHEVYDDIKCLTAENANLSQRLERYIEIAHVTGNEACALKAEIDRLKGELEGFKNQCRGCGDLLKAACHERDRLREALEAIANLYPGEGPGVMASNALKGDKP